MLHDKSINQVVLPTTIRHPFHPIQDSKTSKTWMMICAPLGHMKRSSHESTNFMPISQARKSSADVGAKGTVPMHKSSLAWSDIAGQHDVKSRLLECFSVSEK